MQPNFEETTGLFLQAILFSATKHRDQRRKDKTRSPYINHPLAVANRLWETGRVRDITTLISALLHDTLEDTQTTPDEIKALFGEEILTIVQEVTDDKTLPKQVRKRMQIEHAPNISYQARLIKLADKSCNLHDLLYSPPSSWSFERRQRYLLWSEQVVAGLRGTNKELEEYFDEMLKYGKQLMEIA